MRARALGGAAGKGHIWAIAAGRQRLWRIARIGRPAGFWACKIGLLGVSLQMLPSDNFHMIPPFSGIIPSRACGHTHFTKFYNLYSAISQFPKTYPAISKKSKLWIWR